MDSMRSPRRTGETVLQGQNKQCAFAIKQIRLTECADGMSILIQLDRDGQKDTTPALLNGIGNHVSDGDLHILSQQIVSFQTQHQICLSGSDSDQIGKRTLKTVAQSSLDNIVLPAQVFRIKQHCK